jgi:hypothetical protein
MRIMETVMYVSVEEPVKYEVSSTVSSIMMNVMLRFPEEKRERMTKRDALK